MEVLPDLERKLKDATVRYDEASKARDQKVKLAAVKRELAWAHVRDKEDELGAKLKEISAQDKRLPKIQDNIRKAQVCICVSSLCSRTYLSEGHSGRARRSGGAGQSEA